MSHPRHLPSYAALFVTGAVWGFAFVAQRSGMASMGPFAFNAVRFALGAAALMPVAWLTERSTWSRGGRVVVSAAAAGSALFLGASLQQVGIVTTTAGKAGLITGLYVVIVPLILAVAGSRPPRRALLAVPLAVAGMVLLTRPERGPLVVGDAWVFASAIAFASHVLLVGRIARHVPVLTFAVVQYLVVAAASLIGTLVAEPSPFGGVTAAWGPLLYGGLGSIAVAYTLQFVGQRRVPPTAAAVILSLEGVWAAIGGRILLNEYLGAVGTVGALFAVGAALLAATASSGGGERT